MCESSQYDDKLQFEFEVTDFDLPLASSPGYLQALIVALAVYDMALSMEINLAQTKVMVVSKPSVRSPPAVVTVFACHGLTVEHVDNLKYQGLHLHTSGAISHLIAL